MKMTELTPGVIAWRARVADKKALESGVEKRKVRAVRFCNWEEVEAGAIYKTLNGVVVECKPGDHKQDGFFISYLAKKYFPSVQQVALETIEQDSTPDGIVDESGLVLFKLSNNVAGMKHIPMLFVDEVMY